MKKESVVWTIILVGFVASVVANAVIRGAGKQYIEIEERHFVMVEEATDDKPAQWVEVNGNANGGAALDHDLSNIEAMESRKWEEVSRATPNDYVAAMKDDPNQTTVQFSLMQTIGVWIAAFFTLSILSFLYKDNPFYKVAESCVVGISAAYWMVVGFWSTLVPNLFGKLAPGAIENWVSPGAGLKQDLFYLIPLILSAMLLWRLSPKGGWIARWPMAFIIGVFCGLRMIAFLHADFLAQVRPGVGSLYVTEDDSFLFWASLKALILFIGVLSCLTYFFFSIEHKGVVGKTARVGMGFLMITFGAAFGFTVMGRIALLSIRLEFLFDDWLWLIDPKLIRDEIDTLDQATALLMPVLQSGLF